MKKRQLIDLTNKIKKITGGKIPIICGTQSFFAYADFAPDIVSRSIECDYLFIDLNREIRNKILDEVGLDSDFREKYGYYADPLGLFTVVLPDGWQERLEELRDERGNLIAYCVEIYDTTVSKFIAGREKDFIFIQMLLETEIINIKNFTERLLLLKDSPQWAVVSSRIAILEEFLRKSGRKINLQTLKDLSKSLE